MGSGRMTAEQIMSALADLEAEQEKMNGEEATDSTSGFAIDKSLFQSLNTILAYEELEATVACNSDRACMLRETLGQQQRYPWGHVERVVLSSKAEVDAFFKH